MKSRAYEKAESSAITAHVATVCSAVLQIIRCILSSYIGDSLESSKMGYYIVYFRCFTTNQLMEAQH